jgi:hypothetical protein
MFSKRAFHWLPALLLLSGAVFAQTSAQNFAAFQAAAAETRLSYHWTNLQAGVPVVATNQRFPMPYVAPLTTINFDLLNPSLYQTKIIGDKPQAAVLVSTFSNPNGFWDKTNGTQLTLTYTNPSGTNYIFPYVTVGNELHSYLRTTYFSATNPTSDEVAFRIDQSLGLNPTSNLSNRGLAFFWAPISNIVRSGYLPDITQQVTNLPTFSDGSYQPLETGVPAGFNYVDIKDPTIIYTNNATFVAFNQSQTDFPWTAMGYTYNWNALQDQDYTNSPYGFDTNRATNPVGLSEFMVSGGSQVVLERWVSHSELQTWIIPEPGAVALVLMGLLVIAIARGEVLKAALRPLVCRVLVRRR